MGWKAETMSSVEVRTQKGVKEHINLWLKVT